MKELKEREYKVFDILSWDRGASSGIIVEVGLYGYHLCSGDQNIYWGKTTVNLHVHYVCSLKNIPKGQKKGLKKLLSSNDIEGRKYALSVCEQYKTK